MRVPRFPGLPLRTDVLADHFELAILAVVPEGYANPAEQECLLERSCREYPWAVDSWRDHDGRQLRHTYFYRAEQYDIALIDTVSSAEGGACLFLEARF